MFRKIANLIEAIIAVALFMLFFSFRAEAAADYVDSVPGRLFQDNWGGSCPVGTKYMALKVGNETVGKPMSRVVGNATVGVSTRSFLQKLPNQVGVQGDTNWLQTDSRMTIVSVMAYSEDGLETNTVNYKLTIGCWTDLPSSGGTQLASPNFLKYANDVQAN